MGEGKQKARSRVWRWTWSGAAIVILTLVLLEIALRVMGLTNPVLYMPDEAAGFRLKPDQHVDYLGNEIVINQWGVRDPRPLERTDGRGCDILVLGDSVTWGGILERHEDLFTTQLERAVQSRVVNAGINGYSIAQMVALYREHLQELNPRAIIVFTIPRDFTRPPAVRLTGDSVAFPLEKPPFALPVALSIARLKAHQRWGWFSPAPAAVPVENLTDEECVQRNLDALTQLAEDIPTDTKLSVVVSPSRPDAPNDPLPEEVRDTLVRHGVRVLDLGQAGLATADLFVDDVHLSAKGHGWVARMLAKAFAESLD